MSPTHERRELRSLVRDERSPDHATIVVRGGPESTSRLQEHAERTNDHFTLDGEPAWGVSIFCALDDIGEASLPGLLSRFASYRVVHLPAVGQVRRAGFEILPTFGRPHFTVVLPDVGEATLGRLLDALGAAEPNPYYGGRRPTRR
ncbi:MAG: hypothetical protein ACYDAD_02950 [Acidimicrobiales bacterium]